MFAVVPKNYFYSYLIGLGNFWVDFIVFFRDILQWGIALCETSRLILQIKLNDWVLHGVGLYWRLFPNSLRVLLNFFSFCSNWRYLWQFRLQSRPFFWAYSTSFALPLVLRHLFIERRAIQLSWWLPEYITNIIKSKYSFSALAN